MDDIARHFLCVEGPIIGFLIFAVLCAVAYAGKQHDQND